MNRDTILFVSDVHLEGLDDPRQRVFVEWLEEKAPSLSRLVIGGDLFDLWVGFKGIGFKDVGYHHYFSVLEALRKFKKQGIEIDYIEGNHDFFLGPFFTDVLQANVFEREAIYYLNGLKVSVIHGDLLNERQTGYRCLRSFLRSVLFQAVLRTVPPSWIWRAGRRFSHISRSWKKGGPWNRNEEKIRSLYRELAEKKFHRNADLDVLISGHNHIPDHYSFQFSGRAREYYNLGDWVKNFTYLEHREGNFSLKKLLYTPERKLIN